MVDSEWLFGLGLRDESAVERVGGGKLAFYPA
jgi:hypothetical protein